MSENTRKKDLRKAELYLNHSEHILKEIQSKPAVNVLFFVMNMSMWKYDGLVKLLLQDSHFNVLLVSFEQPSFDKEYNYEQQNIIKDYCLKQNIPFRPGYNFISNSYNDISDFKPDVVVYTQPYNVGYEPWLIDAYKDHSLFVYTPYGITVTSGNYFYDTYLTNIAWKIFVGCEIEKNILRSCQTLNKNNHVITGFSISDKLEKSYSSPWGQNTKKKIIWAPHHSIDNRFSFANSCFEQICEFMLEIAQKYENDIEIAFKPHPLLKERLIEKWGQKYTVSYYKKWAEMPNTFICESEYSDIFAFSDGMIHDSASFVCEYLLTLKPAFYTVLNDQVPPGINNELGQACFYQHYHGLKKEEILHFIEDVILRGNDVMSDKRVSFVKSNLLPPENNSVAENMYNEFKKLIG